MREFFNGYYGAAGPFLLQYIDFLCDTVEESGYNLRCYNGSVAGWLTLEKLDDALTLYKSAHPDEFKKTETKKADTKAKGDEERKNVAKKVAGNNKSTNKTAAEESGDNKRKYYRPGMSTQDVLDRVLQDLD